MRLAENAFELDLQIFRWCQQRRYRKLLIVLARQLSRSADGYIYILIGVLALFFKHYQFVAIAVTAFVIERSLYFVIKNYFRRHRPPDIIPGFTSVVRASDKFSFPSGHTSAAFLMASAIVLFFPGTAWFVYPWAASVGWSRVMLGVHFPGDTIAGALLGSSVIYWVYNNFSALSFEAIVF